MITTKELCEWKKEVENTKQQALQQAKAYIHNEGMRLYYVNLTQVADAQLALVQRMIRQSEANEKEQICQK